MIEHFISLLRQDRFSPVQLWEGRGELPLKTAYELIEHLLGVDIRSNAHPNFFHLYPLLHKEITIDQTLELLYFLKMTATLPTKRVCLISDATLLNRQSTNALLKTLEEPPSETLFILITPSFGRLIPTLLSRCSKVRFPSVTTPQVGGELVQMWGQLILLMLGRGSTYVGQKLELIGEEDQKPLIDTILCFLAKVIKSHGNPDISAGIRQLLAMKPLEHWVNAFLACEDYLGITPSAHLPQKDVIRGILYLINDPNLSIAFPRN